jgi:ubiquinone/menaquinone biosynthesis C-methylase UbiE
VSQEGPQTSTTAIDLEALKRRQQATWALGDYGMIGTQIVLVSELLVEALDLRSTERVLDVATGTGNAALAAARRGCAVIGVDYVPGLLDRAKQRAAVDGLEVSFLKGDAEALPFDDGAFDVVLSVFGAMFAPDHERTADELARVCRPDGRIGLASHTPDGFLGQLFKTNGRHVAPPAGLTPPVLWGTEEHLRELFGPRIKELRAEKRAYTWRYRSAQAYIDYWRRYYGPTIRTFDALDADGKADLERDILDLIARFNRADDGSMVVPSEYLEVVIVIR